MSRIWSFLGSVKLMILIVSVLAITSMVGTLIIQESQASQPLSQIYSPKTLYWLKFWGLIDLYHSPFFVSLLGIFAVNLIIGTIQIWPRNMKIMKAKPRPLKSHEFPEFKHQHEFTISTQDLPLLKKIYSEKLTGRFHKPQILEEFAHGFQLYVQKGKFSKCIVFFIHLSLLIIIVGSMIGSIWGFEGNVNIAEGETVNYYFEGVELTRRPLPFAITCEKFSLEYYPNTTQPKSYLSKLKIIQAGDMALEKTINVNDPLKFQGINIYQASYGELEKPVFKLRVMNQETKKEYRVRIGLDDPVSVPKENVLLKLLSYTPQFDQFGPAIKLGVKEQKGNPFPVVALKSYPGFDAFHRKGKYTYILDDIQEKYFTGLQIASNPGIEMILTGCGMLILGLFLSAFWSFRKFWINVENNRVRVAGKSTKYPLNFESEVNKLVQRLKEVSV